MAQGTSEPNADTVQDDSTLCLGIQQRNSRSETYFFEKYRALAIRWASRRIASHCDAEDLAHDALLTVLTRLRAQPLNDPSALQGFVRRTVDYTVIGYQRKQARRRTHLVGEWPDYLYPIEDQSFDLVAKSEACGEIQKLVGDLTQQRDRQILRMKFFEGRPKPDICGALGVSPEQFDRLFYRAKKRLRSLIEDCGKLALS